jgi:hypothetical protein
MVDFDDAPVFDAIAYASIIIGQKLPPPGTHKVKVYKWTATDSVSAITDIMSRRSSLLAQSCLKPDGWRLESSMSFSILEKLRNVGRPLSDFVDGQFYRGIITGLNEAFVVDQKTRDDLIAEDQSSERLLRPFLRGRDVKRWYVDWQNLWLITFPHGFNGQLDKYPAILKHLTQFEKLLKNRGQCKSSRSGKDTGQHHWLELDNNPKPEFLKSFEQSKLILPAIANKASCVVDHEGFYSNDKTSICVSDKVLYLAGILNSTVGWWVIQQTASAKQNGFFEFKPMYVSQIPIPAATPAQQTEIEKRVEQILALKKENPDADVSALETEIDQLVYKLYNLTPAEVDIVEGLA